MTCVFLALIILQLAKTHGDIFTLWFGRTPIIILNGFHAVKDGLTTHPEDVSGRLLSPFFKTMAKGKGEKVLAHKLHRDADSSLNVATPTFHKHSWIEMADCYKELVLCDQEA